MPNETQYAILCETEEEARDVMLNWKWKLYAISNAADAIVAERCFHRNKIITYAEAKEKGLLGEVCRHRYKIINEDFCSSNCEICWHKIEEWISVFDDWDYSYETTAQEPKGEVCKSCLGKKQLSVIDNQSYTDEWTGKYHHYEPTIKMEDCSRCKGTGQEPKFIPEETSSIWYIKENGGEIILDSEPKEEKICKCCYPYNPQLSTHCIKCWWVVRWILKEQEPKFIPEGEQIYNGDDPSHIFNGDKQEVDQNDTITIERKVLEDIVQSWKRKLEERSPYSYNIEDFLEDLNALLYK